MKLFFQELMIALFEWVVSIVFKITLRLKTRTALNACNGDRKKRWLVRGRYTYIIFTDGMVQYNKNKGILSEDTTAKKMDETADRIIIWDSVNQQARIFGNVNK